MSSGMRMQDDGTAVWNIPLTVAIRVGGFPPVARGAPTVVPGTSAATPPAVSAGGSERKLEVDPDYSDRDGYNAAFSAALPFRFRSFPLPRSG